MTYMLGDIHARVHTCSGAYMLGGIHAHCSGAYLLGAYMLRTIKYFLGFDMIDNKSTI